MKKNGQERPEYSEDLDWLFGSSLLMDYITLETSLAHDTYTFSREEIRRFCENYRFLKKNVKRKIK